MKRIHSFVFLTSAALILCAVAAPARPSSVEKLMRIVVEAGAHTRIDTPLSVPIDVPVGDGQRPLLLEEIVGADRLTVPCQIEGGRRPRLCWIMAGRTAAGMERVFELVRAPWKTQPGVEAIVGPRALTLRIGEHKVLDYVHAILPPPEGKSELYGRSGFVHPLWSPSGEELTRIHPADHVHHMGLWNPWTKGRFEGRDVDFWNIGSGTGTVRFKSFSSTVSGPVFGGFSALHEHVDLSAPEGEKIALLEDWAFRAWNPGKAKTGSAASPGRGWIIDVTSTMRCATSSPLLLKKYRYGGLGFRAAESFDKGDYLTSEGKKREDGHATRARWCIVHGPTAKGPAGVVFMSHPENRGHPEPMRIWNGTPRIFFNFCPIQAKEWTLEPSKVYVLKYRMFVYDGTLTAEDADRLWNDFGDPPVTRIEALKPQEK